MTGQQYLEAQPTHDSIIYHLNQLCDIRHKTNRTQDACDYKMERAEEAICGESCRCECPAGAYHLDVCKCDEYFNALR